MRVAAMMLLTTLATTLLAEEGRPAFEALALGDQQTLLSWLAPRCAEAGGGGDVAPILRKRPGLLGRALLEAFELGPSGDLIEARRKQLKRDLELRRDWLGSEGAREALPAELLELELRATEDAVAFVQRGLERYAAEWRAASLTGMGANCATDARGLLEALAEGEDPERRLAAKEALTALDRCE